MKVIKRFGKYFCLFISWLIFSPLYFYLSKRISNQSVYTRSIWTILSPLSILLIFSISSLKEMSEFTSRSAIHRITEAELPYKYIYNINGFLNYSIRDHGVICNARFFQAPTEAQYEKLDLLCNTNKSYWSKSSVYNKEVYTYSRMWGNGYDAPHGENENEDRFLYISLTKGDKKLLIKYGSW